jgi:hypothetical protein
MTDSLRVVAVVALAALALACGMVEGKEKAEHAVVEFHAKFNASEFGEIYQASSVEFQKGSSKDDYLKFIGAVHRKLGDVTASKPAGWRVNVMNGTTYVLLGYESTYERGTAQESFTYKVSGESVQLVNYNVNSKDLIIN